MDNPKPQEGQILHILFRQIFEEKIEMLQNLHFPGESQHPQRILGLEGHLNLTARGQLLNPVDKSDTF